jgi:hypothetical protein
MATTQEYALLSLFVYQVKRDGINRPNLPAGWALLESRDDNLLGFSYGVFKRSGTNEIVLSYTGTNGLIDWASNLTAGAGLPSWQVTNAALVYQQTKEKYGSNITLSGHSLGGGLASVMATWFNRPAVVFDPAPTQAVATDVAVVNSVVGSLGGANVPQSIRDYSVAVASQFTARESNVTSYYAPGSAVRAISTDANTITKRKGSGFAMLAQSYSASKQ